MEYVNCANCICWLRAGDKRHPQSANLFEIFKRSDVGVCARNAPSPSLAVESIILSVIKKRHFTNKQFDKGMLCMSNEIKSLFKFPITSDDSGCFQGEKKL